MNTKTDPNEQIASDLAGYGLTKREYFAAMAMQGLSTEIDCPTKETVLIAVKLADALIAELNKEVVK